MEVSPPYRAKKIAEDLLCLFNILVKDCTAKTIARNREYIRVAIRDTKDNDRLVEKLKCLQP
jgi:histidinol-phosphate/aromatic aminotransferase/cobyric acid decarboxylase-like protein